MAGIFSRHILRTLTKTSSRPSVKISNEKYQSKCRFEKAYNIMIVGAALVHREFHEAIEFLQEFLVLVLPLHPYDAYG